MEKVYYAAKIQFFKENAISEKLERHIETLPCVNKEEGIALARAKHGLLIAIYPISKKMAMAMIANDHSAVRVG